MPPSGNSKPPFSRVSDGRGPGVDPASGIAHVLDGSRVLFAAPSFLRATHTIMHAEKPGAWSAIFHSGGIAAGQAFAALVDCELARLGQPVLTDLPLESCLVFAERHFVEQGWGVLTIDLTDAAEQGLVIARLKHSSFVAALGPGDDFSDALPAGFLQGFLEFVSGQALGCLEIGCARTGAPHCTFVITSAERLDPIQPSIGRTKPEEILAQLKA